MANADEDNKHYYWIFIDHSNLFITSQKYMAKGLRVNYDPRTRIEYGTLIQSIFKRMKAYSTSSGSELKIINERVNVYLYGSEPPPLDTLWTNLRKKGVNVQTFHRNHENKEKQVDTAMVAEITDTAASNKNKQGTFIIISGDRDFKSGIDKAIKYGFKIQVVSFKHALSGELRYDSSLGKIHLDDLIKECCYFAYDYDNDKTQVKVPPPENSLIILFDSACVLDKKRKEEIAIKSTQIFQLPCMYSMSKKAAPHLILTFVPKPDKNIGVDYNLFDKDYANLVDGMNRFLSEQFGNHFKEINSLFNFLNESTSKAQGGVSSSNKFADLPSDYESGSSDSETTTEAAVLPKEDANSSDSENKSEKEWHVVEKKAKKKSQKYSDQCPKGFTCQYGSKCRYKHTEQEKKLFKNSNGKGVIGYKSKMCQKISNCKNQFCTFAHSEKELICYTCNKTGDHAWSDCPNKEPSQPAQ